VAYTSEIEKLEKRWLENPKGRNFAPLADAYRKAGELDRALDLCKAGLELHPDYVSAHIVFGRCLMDQKNDPGASEVFRKVLALDPENVLALKILAEIADRGHRYDEAVDWLTRLLSADPMNGDAAEALTRARGRAAHAAARPSSPAAAAPVRAGAPEAVVRLVPDPTPAPPRRDFVVEHESETRVADPVPMKAAPPRGEIETYDGTLDFNSVAHDAAKAEGLEVQEEVELKPQDLVVEGLAHTQYDSVPFEPPPGASESEAELPTIDLPLIMPDDVAAEPAGPAPAAQRAPAAPVGGGAVPATPAAVTLSDDDGAADTAALSRAEPVVTETMAELYLRQGHPDEALRVYEALLAKRPGDRRLRARVAGLSSGDPGVHGGDTGESVQTFLRRILAGRPPARGQDAAPDPEPLAAPESPGSPLDGAFAIAPPEFEPEPEILAPGEASRPADDTITLDAVFGEESPRSAPAPEASTAPPVDAAPAPPTPPAPGGFSFDQFFSPPSAPPGGAAPPPEGNAAPSGPVRGSGSKMRPPMEDEGDLDQFQAWLRGLKS
jgi:tetratricopeptide (TPR) repeat protein